MVCNALSSTFILNHNNGSGLNIVIYYTLCSPATEIMTNINQIVIISCNIRWILVLTSERNKALTFLWEVLTTQMEHNSDFSEGIKF